MIKNTTVLKGMLGLPAWMIILSKVFELEQSKKEVIQFLLVNELGIQYSHIVNVVKELTDKGLLTKTIKGRRRVIQLTEKGQDFAKSCGYMVKLRESLNV